MKTKKNVYNSNYSYYIVHLEDWKRPLYRLWWFIRIVLEIIIPIRLAKKSRVLSVGAGLGQLEHILSKIFKYNVYMVDVSPYAKELNRKLFGVQNYIVSSSSSLPFKDNFFDLVISYDFFEHLKDKIEAENVLKEMKRVLKKKKGINMFHKVTVGEEEEIDIDPTHKIKWSSEVWKEWFESNGWYTVMPTSHYIPRILGGKVGLINVRGAFYLSQERR